MPYVSEKIPLPPQYDRRRKLTEDDKFEIVRLRKEHNLSQRTLARMFGVSRKLIISRGIFQLYENVQKQISYDKIIDKNFTQIQVRKGIGFLLAYHPQ